LLESDKFLDTPFQDLEVEDEEDAMTELRDNAYFGSKGYLGKSASGKMDDLWK